MTKTELVVQYRQLMLAQQYSKEEVDGTVAEFERVLEIRPHMFPILVRQFLNPAPKSWLIEETPGKRLNPANPLKSKKKLFLNAEQLSEKRRRAGENSVRFRKSLQTPQKKQGSPVGTVYGRTRRKQVSSEQRLFNNKL